MKKDYKNPELKITTYTELDIVVCSGGDMFGADFGFDKNPWGGSSL